MLGELRQADFRIRCSTLTWYGWVLSIIPTSENVHLRSTSPLFWRKVMPEPDMWVISPLPSMPLASRSLSTEPIFFPNHPMLVS